MDTKKLTLTKETLQTLAENQQSLIQGGMRALPYTAYKDVCQSVWACTGGCE